MKRILLIVASILLLVFLGGWGFLTYRQQASYRTLVPKNASSLIRINTDALVRDIAWNALWNQAHYSKGGDSDKTLMDRKKWRQSSIQLPANIYLYTFNNQHQGVYFGTLPIADSIKFHAFASQTLGMNGAARKQGSFVQSDDQRFSIAYSNRRVAFALSPTGHGGVLDVLTDLLSHENMVQVKESTLKGVNASAGHVAFADAQYTAAVHFKNGRILFSGQCAADITDSLAGRPNFPDSNTVNLWLHANLSSFLGRKSYSIGQRTVHGDSLLAYYKGSLQMEWKGTTKQQDTAITYGYNDDFELEEQMELIEKQVPELYLTIKSNTEGLAQYLMRQGILDSASNKLNRDLFPLFDVRAQRIDSNYFQLNTAGRVADLAEDTGLHSQELLYLHADIRKMRTQAVSPFIEQYLHALSAIEVVGEASAPHQVSIQGHLSMENKTINSLVVLAESF